MSDSFPRLAAVRFSKGESIESILEAAIGKWRRLGVHLAGHLQREEIRLGHRSPVTYLQNIASGELMQISQALGAGAMGCKLDPQALLDIAQKLVREVDSEPDLLVINRFGRGEAEGHGLRPAIENAFARDIPVLVAVRDEYLEDWRVFAGESAIELDANLEDVLNWFQPLWDQTSRQEAIMA